MSRFFSAKLVPVLSFILGCSLSTFSVASDLKSAGGPETLQGQTPGFEAPLKKAAALINERSYNKAENILLDVIGKNLPEKDRAFFLLGRLYKEEGAIEKAESYFIKAAEAYPLLRDYALQALTDMYLHAEKYEKIPGIARQIKNSLLLQYARQSEIKALLALNKKKEAAEAFSGYIEDYPSDWDHKLTFAVLLKNDGRSGEAARLLKEIYINAVPVSNSALKELKSLKADTFTKDEILTRAGRLFEKDNFQRAETEYQAALKLADDPERDKIRFSVAMCRFRLKQYTKASQSFGSLKTPEAMHLQAQALYRMDDREGFEKVRREFEKTFPGDDRLALLLIMEGEDFRRQGDFDRAGKSFKEVLKGFPSKSEDALWGMGWMNYVSGNYAGALHYFSQLAAYDKSDNYYKYLYWKGRSGERVNEECLKQQAPLQFNDKAGCDPRGKDFFTGLPADGSFYGYLIKMRSSENAPPDKLEISRPKRPEGEVYERIEALALLGMRDEAVNEIIDRIKRIRKKEDVLYLGGIAMELGEYRKVIAFAEKEQDLEFLPYSYPFGFGEVIEEAAYSRDVDKYLVAAVIREESRFDPKAVSWAGAMGLMQLMPATAYRLKKDISLRVKDRSEIHDVNKNILLGTHYLSKLIREFKNVPLALAAYNAGENALKRWMAKYNKDDLIEFIENIPYKETRLYVKKVLKSYWRYRTINGLPVEGSQIAAQGKL
ncbi:MAG: transglycosylase SLT domain-containing protein [Nitrospirae bacterium]|nr:transglycosylase SLT domain-containing protein [Nitrospirota bacterium]